MTSIAEKGGGSFKGIKLLLCENPLPPIEEAVAAAQAQVPHSNYYTEPYSEPLRSYISESIGVPERLVHVNAGSELILRQIFDRLGDHVHLLTPTYVLFPEIAGHYSETRLLAENDFAFGVRTFPTETYFFLADFAPHNAGLLADRLKEHNFFIKPLHDSSLGAGFMRVTTALPDDNDRFI